MKKPVSLETARDLLLSAFEFDAVERVDTMDALGRVCASDVPAEIDVPPFETALFDGFATRSSTGPLNIIDEIHAGTVSRYSVDSGSAVRIMTGACLPVGADRVVPLEAARVDGGKVYPKAERVPGRSVEPAGSRVRRGSVVLRRGEEITADVLQRLVSAGVGTLDVHSRPDIGIYATGNELVAPGDMPGPGRIPCSNDVYLAARMAELGAPARRWGILRDDAGEIREALEAALEFSHLVITSGGVGGGDKDLLPDVLREICGDVLFHGVDITPGKAAAAASRQGRLIIALSGNPFAVHAGFELLVRPVLAAMTRLDRLNPRSGKAVFRGTLNKKRPGRKIVPGVLFTENTLCCVITGGPAAAGRGLCIETCLVDVPAEVSAVRDGDIVEIFL